MGFQYTMTRSSYDQFGYTHVTQVTGQKQSEHDNRSNRREEKERYPKSLI